MPDPNDTKIKGRFPLWPTLDGCRSLMCPFHMTERSSSPLKRRRDSHQGPPPKRQKPTHPERPPPAFWDNLSKIPLTRAALEELDRRNAESASSTSLIPTRRSVTRRAAAKGSVDYQPAAKYVLESTQARLQEIKRWARTGGLDLSDLIGVCLYQIL